MFDGANWVGKEVRSFVLDIGPGSWNPMPISVFRHNFGCGPDEWCYGVFGGILAMPCKNRDLTTFDEAKAEAIEYAKKLLSESLEKLT